MTTDNTAGKLFLSDEERTVLHQVCQEVGTSPKLVEALIVEEAKVYGMGRRHLIWTQIDALLREFAGKNGGTEG